MTVLWIVLAALTGICTAVALCYLAVLAGTQLVLQLDQAELERLTRAHREAERLAGDPPDGLRASSSTVAQDPRQAPPAAQEAPRTRQDGPGSTQRTASGCRPCARIRALVGL